MVQQEVALHAWWEKSGAIAVMSTQNFNGLEGHIFKRMDTEDHGMTGLQHNLDRRGPQEVSDPTFSHSRVSSEVRTG